MTTTSQQKLAALKSAHPGEMSLHKDLKFTSSISCCFLQNFGEGGDRSGTTRKSDDKSQKHPCTEKGRERVEKMEYIFLGDKMLKPRKF
ncbi:hypothetical protein CEXT_2141 [Caerostris extrusa]|uniref:Uncharacterized protein n=1 Tax=Caerostris extrusa TaxID=172846 RepID=A0AAV4UYR6_CAEEX|nr:hypothetical protein CEXT_2141 [Caerostris extrusa]